MIPPPFRTDPWIDDYQMYSIRRIVGIGTKERERCFHHIVGSDLVGDIHKAGLPTNIEDGPLGGTGIITIPKISGQCNDRSDLFGWLSFLDGCDLTGHLLALLFLALGLLRC